MTNKEAAETLRNLASGANPYFMAQIRAKGNLFKLYLQAAEALEYQACWCRDCKYFKIQNDGTYCDNLDSYFWSEFPDEYDTCAEFSRKLEAE